MIAIDLSGKTAVVTGGGRGLGAATVRALHRAGANVVVDYVNVADNRDKAEALVEDLGARCLAVEADVRDPAAVERLLARTVDEFGGLDIVVNNAAVLRDKTVRKMTDEQWRDVIDTNVTGVFHVCRAAADRIRKGGRIVNMASISAVVGFFGQANYAAAKAGVIGMTRTLSREFAGRGVLVNAVAPGVALTEMGRSIPEDVRSKMLENVPLGRFAEPGEIAGVVVFLCSPLADYVTGQTIHVNGGWWA